MGAELKPCPFCGGDARMRREHDPDMTQWHYVQCFSCSARTGGKWATETCPQFFAEVRDEWNNREEEGLTDDEEEAAMGVSGDAWTGGFAANH